jgi:outer membrane protein assembly factor BamB
MGAHDASRRAGKCLAICAAVLLSSLAPAYAPVAVAAAEQPLIANELMTPGHNAYSPDVIDNDLDVHWQRRFDHPVSYALTVGGRTFVQAGFVLHALSPADGSTLWAADLGGFAFDPRLSTGDSTYVVVVDDTVVVSNQAHRRIEGRDAATGLVKWVQPFPGDAPGDAGTEAYIRLTAAEDGVVWVSSNMFAAFGVDASTGKFVAALEGVASSDRLTVDDGALYTLTDCVSRSFALPEGEERWITSGECDPYPEILSWAGVAAEGSYYNQLGQILDADTGEETGTWSGEAPPVRAGSKIFTTRDGTLHALHAVTGAPQWQFEGDAALAGSSLVVGDKVYAASTNGHLYEADTATGEQLAVHALPAPYGSAPYGLVSTMTYANGIVYVPTRRVLTAYTGDSYTGPAAAPAERPEVRWPRAMPDRPSDNYLGGPGHNNVHRSHTHPRDVEPAWSRRLPGFVSAPLIVGNRVIAVANQPDGYHPDGAPRHDTVVAMSRRTGRVVWERALPVARLHSSGDSHTAYTAGAVYLLTSYGHLWKIDPRTGVVQWDRRLTLDDSWVACQAPLTARRGHLYIVCRDESYAVDVVGEEVVAFYETEDTGTALAVNRRLVLSDWAHCNTAAFKRRTGRPLWYAERCPETGASHGTTPVLHRGVSIDTEEWGARITDLETGLDLVTLTAEREPVIWGNLAFTLVSGAIRVVEWPTGTVLWTRSRSFTLPPVIAGRHAYAVTHSGELIAMHTATGKVTTVSDALGAPTGSRPLDEVTPPALSVAEGILAVPHGRRLHVFDIGDAG